MAGTQFYQVGGQGQGSSFPAPIVAARDPVSSSAGVNGDIYSPNGWAYPVGQQWQNSLTLNVFYYEGAGQWVLFETPTGEVTQFTADSGTALPSAGNINLLGGTGASTVASGSTVTINVTGGGIEYSVVTTNTQMAINQGYITNKSGSAATMTLPATAAVGSVVSVVGLNATGWSIAQATGQQIHMNSVSTTSGASGSLASSAQYNSVLLLCTVANTDWTVISSEGVLTVT